MIFQMISTILLVGHVISLQNGLAKTPPMEWMSWSYVYCETDCVSHPSACVNEDLFMEIADRLVVDGYRDAGYTFVNLDDCWAEKERSSDGKLVANRTRFPSGINALSKYMHDRGLKLGIYSDVGYSMCISQSSGSWQHEDVDAQTFADWGIDYLKYDGCYLDYNQFPIGFPKMSDALNKTGRPIVY
jgi:hypothetical protein